jgi:hypothetical protein
MTDDGNADHGVLHPEPDRDHDVTGTEPSSQTASRG